MTQKESSIPKIDSAIYINVLIPPLLKPYTYQLPAFLYDKIKIGQLIEIPLGRRKASGYVVDILNKESLPLELCDIKIKEIYGITILKECFNKNHLQFFKWISKYYCYPLSQVLDTAIPTPLGIKKVKFLKINKEKNLSDFKLGKVQKEIYEFIFESGKESISYDLLKDNFKSYQSQVKKLLEIGVLILEQKETIEEDPFKSVVAPEWAKTDVELNSYQLEAFKRITAVSDKNENETFLLHGITGSGKTEVYIEAIKYILDKGKSAIIIVPEISLTPQLIDRFKSRLGNTIGVLHSALKGKVRWSSWQAILDGKYKVAIGARSAIFAPVTNLGIIIVDEEHEGSYKQHDDLRYNGRDIAIARGMLEKCPVILGSATPSLETFYNSTIGKYSYLSIPARHQNKYELKFQIINLKDKKPWEKKSKHITYELYDALVDTLKNKEQTFILYNKRGFASFIQCETCGESLICPNCSVTLTYHQNQNKLICHYCDHTTSVPSICPKCEVDIKLGKINPEKMLSSQKVKDPLSANDSNLLKNKGVSNKGISSDITKSVTPIGKLAFRGAGTEKVFDELCELFPEAIIKRLDKDTATKESEYRSVMDSVRTQETDILVGTQMIAKGHDLPNVTLVGIVDSDIGVHMPDFRASEKVFQLLTQVSGRAGRADKPGKIILQTRSPGLPCIVYTINQDYLKFAASELQFRKTMNYPPFNRLLRIIATSSDDIKGIEILNLWKNLILKIIDDEKLTVKILGPTSATIAKIKSNFRFHMLLKAKSVMELNLIVQMLQKIRKNSKNLRVIFDIDPVDML